MAGRPSKYYTHVLPRFGEIKEWLRIGVTDKEIAQHLGISQDSFCEYKHKFSEFSELIKKERQNPVLQLKAALFKKAIGFKYEETTIVDSEKNGRTTTQYIKTALPDPAAALILLKHWDKDTEWASDPATLAIKKAELKLKQEQIINESEGWE